MSIQDEDGYGDLNDAGAGAGYDDGINWLEEWSWLPKGEDELDDLVEAPWSPGDEDRLTGMASSY